jgi:hypothetical protein
MLKTLQIALIPLVVCTGIGCSSGTPQATPSETKAFKGGPMPESFRQQFQASQQATADARTKKMADAAAAAKASDNSTATPQ